mmetsp:Transcript_14082/g.34096  ORF Transcript_14082/g.34096 Transcript_14082/m.34096 type:complete len:281 (-) Transcript_14082:168-1010(-)
MDLLVHMFDKNLRSHITRKRITRNDPKFDTLLVSIAQDPRSKQSITAAVDIAEVGRDIGRNTNLKDLSLDDLHCLDHTDIVLSAWMFNLLCEGINENKSIQSLTVSNFSHNQWQLGHFLRPFLANNPSLRSMCVMTGGGYTRSAENMRLLVSPLLERDDPLGELCFIENAVNDEMVCVLVDEFLKNPSLAPKKLQIAACGFGFAGCQALAKLLKSPSCTTETLDISDNYIEDDGAACLAEALVMNNTLSELSLEGNRITTKGWRAFSSVTCFVRRQHERL